MNGTSTIVYDLKTIHQLNELITRATEPIPTRETEWYIKKLEFLKDKPLFIFTAEQGYWYKKESQFLDILVYEENNLLTRPLFGKILPFTTNTKKIYLVSLNNFVDIPLKKSFLAGFKEQTYFHQNSNLYYITEDTLVLRTPKKLVEKGKPQYLDSIIMIKQLPMSKTL